MAKNKSKSKSKTKKKKNVFNLVSDVAQIFLILVLLGVSVASFGARIPVLAERGLQFYAVTSGSMEPAIPTGSLIKVGKYKLEDLKKDDVITFKVPQQNEGQPVVLTHRITKVDKQEEVKILGEGDEQTQKNVITYSITTKGDANNTEDQYQVKAGDILGKYEWHLPFIGYISGFSQTPQGFIFLVIVPAIILIVWEIVSLVMHFKQKSLQETEAELKELKKELAEQKKQQKKKEED